MVRRVTIKAQSHKEKFMYDQVTVQSSSHNPEKSQFFSANFHALARVHMLPRACLCACGHLRRERRGEGPDLAGNV